MIPMLLKMSNSFSQCLFKGHQTCYRAVPERTRRTEPSAYKVQRLACFDKRVWTILCGSRMIHSILTNPTYTGDLAQGRSRVKSYKVHQIEAVPREEWWKWLERMRPLSTMKLSTRYRLSYSVIPVLPEGREYIYSAAF